MKRKLGITLVLLFVLNLECLALRGTTNSNPAFKPDGNPVAGQRRKRRPHRYTRRRTKIERASDTGTGSSVDGNRSSDAEPVEEPTMAAPPPVEARPDLAPGRRAPAKRSSAPKIKPPTVQIKPPTR
jgi:hypothetical protein